MNRTDRLCALVQELRACAPCRRSARELAALYEVSARTIERDTGRCSRPGCRSTPMPGGPAVTPWTGR